MSAPIQTLRDNFNDNSRDTSLWNYGIIEAGGTGFEDSTGTYVLEQNNRVEISIPAANRQYAGYKSVNTYSLRSSSVVVELFNVACDTDANESVEFVVALDTDNLVSFMIEGNGSSLDLICRRKVSGSITNVATVSYNATTHRWLRIRHDGTNIQWDTSTDGASWTNRATWSPTFSLTAMRVNFRVGCFVAGQTGNVTGHYDNLNIISGEVSYNVSESNLFFSPGNWYKATYQYAQSNNPGSYLKGAFNGTGLDVRIDSSMLSATTTNNPVVAWRVDGGSISEQQLTNAEFTTITVATGLSSGNHTFELFFRGMSTTLDRWTTPVNVVRVTMVRVVGTGLNAPTLSTKRWLVFGDSISEGVNVDGTNYSALVQDAASVFGLQLGAANDAEVGIIAFNGQGWDKTGSGNVPKFHVSGDTSNQSWRYYWNTQARNYSGIDAIFVVIGTNDSIGAGGPTASATITSYTANFIYTFRTLYPNIAIYVVHPPGGYSTVRTAMNSGFIDADVYDSYMLSTSHAGLEADLDNTGGTTGTYSQDDIHPNQAGHNLIATLLDSALDAPTLQGGAVEIADSAHISGSANTTARLTPPAGKTTGDFTAGKIQETNPAASVTIGENDYTEFVWPVEFLPFATEDDVYEFRITNSGNVISSYDITPQLTVIASATVSANFTANAIIKKSLTQNFSASAIIKKTVTQNISANAIIRATATQNFTTNAVIVYVSTANFAADAFIIEHPNAPYVTNFSTFNTAGTAATDIVLDKPLGTAEGDLMLVQILYGIFDDALLETGDSILLESGDRLLLEGGDPQITPPSGWISLYNTQGVNGRHRIYYKIAGASEPADYTWSLNIAKIAVGAIVTIKNADPTSPILTHAQNLDTSNHTNVPSPGLTLTEDNVRLVFFVGANVATGGVTPDADTIETWDEFDLPWQIEMAHWYQAAAGATTTQNATVNTTDESFAVLVAVVGQLGLIYETFTADAIIKKAASGNFSANAVIQAAQTTAFDADAIIQKAATQSFTAAAIIQKAAENTFNASAIIQATGTGNFTADAYITGVLVATFTADAIIQRAATGNITTDAIILVVSTQNITANAIILKTVAQNFGADAIISKTITANFTTNAIISKTAVQNFTTNAIIFAATTANFNAAAIIQKSVVTNFTTDAVIVTYLAEQSAYQWRNDDDDEVNATDKSAENAPATTAPDTNIRLRIQVNIQGNTGAVPIELEYRKKDSGDPWVDVPLEGA